MKKKKAIVLGAGIAGISAAYHLQQKGEYDVCVYEKSGDWGGLCGGFYVDSAKGKFWFDNAVHLSFTGDKYAKSTFHTNAPPLTHIPNPINYYEGIAIKHPAQNNLYNLPLDIKVNVLKDMIENKNKRKIKTYEDWLRTQYGDFFTENFVKKYTRKYWTLEAKDLSTSWVGGRFYIPNLDEILRGAMSDDTPNTYYAAKMNYPKEGQYRSFVKNLAKSLNIKYYKKATQITPDSAIFNNDEKVEFSKLISTLPINEIIKFIPNAPNAVKNAASKLQATSVAIVSFGFKKSDIAKNLWLYVYDEDKLFARVYSPSLKSPNNAPDGCSSLQAEIYFSAFKPLENILSSISNQNPPPQLANNKIQQILINHTKQQFIKLGVCKEDDIICEDCRILPFGNVIFTHKMEHYRRIVLDFITSLGIVSCGRFGEWDYLWSDQSFLSGKNAVEKI